MFRTIVLESTDWMKAAANIVRQGGHWIVPNVNMILERGAHSEGQIKGDLTARCFAIGSLVIFLVANAISVLALDYPTKPIRIIDPYPPGGATDYLDRIVAKKLSESVGQPVIVDNRPGADGNLSAELAARAIPDGYTLHMNLTGGMASGRILFPQLVYDIRKDFAYVTLVAAGMYVLVYTNWYC
jgi:tripartite-type tricarboxylate transporter receptor subunit TctC